MTQIRKLTDAIVLRLKQTAQLADVRFVRAYASERVEQPIRGMLAVVGINQTERRRGCIGGFLSSAVRGELYAGEAEIRVYTMGENGGDGLTETVGELLACLYEADSEQVITEAAASPVAFDMDLSAFYRTVTFRLAYAAETEARYGG